MRKQGGPHNQHKLRCGLRSHSVSIFYSVTKAGARTLALANELRPFNITSALSCGIPHTGFTAARVEQEVTASMEVQLALVTRMEKDEQNGGSPEAIGKIILKLAQKKRVKPLYTAGFQYKLFVMLSAAAMS